MTEIAVRPDASPALFATDPTGGRLVAWAGAATAAHSLAQSLSKTSFVPKAFQGNAADATAAIILGDELGLSPLSALRSIYIISGTPALYARTMVALAMSHGHEVWTESSTDREVIVCGRRRGSEHVERVTWSIDRARKAGYTNNKKYDTDPQAMLWAKAAGEVARKIAADVLSGVPLSVEDLELDPENQPTAKVARTTRAVQRQAKPEIPEPEFDEPAAESVVKAQAERVRQSISEGEAEIRSGAPLTTLDDVVPITPKQLTALNAALSQDLGFTERDDKLAYLSGALGREIESSKDLTKREATDLIDRIQRDMYNPEPELPGAES